MSRFIAWLPMLVVALLVLGGCKASSQEAPGNLVFHMGRYTDGIPAVPDALTESMRPYRAARSANALGWLDDGLLISTRFAESEQLHRVASALGAREQLTFFDTPVLGGWVPAISNPAYFVYARDDGGSEFYQLYLFDAASQRSTRLTDGNSRHEAPVWSTSGSELAYTRVARGSNERQIMIHAMGAPAQVLLATREGAWYVLDFSPDDAAVLIRQYVSINESHLYELDRGTGALTPLLDPTLTLAIGTARYDHAGGILFTSDLGSEFVRLHRLDRTTGRIEVLTGDLAWDVETFDVAPDGSRVAMSVNEDGASRLSVLTLPSRAFVALPRLPVGVMTTMRFDAAGGRLAISMSNAQSSSDAYVIDLSKRSIARWTRSETGGIDLSRLADPDLIRYPTFDHVDGQARQIPAFVYRPRTVGPHPSLILIHGGPEAQYRPYFSATVAYLVNELGIAVIAPNVRGSAGYGKSFLKLDNGVLREDSVKDIGALLNWIAATPEFDASRVAVMGGSYGGYMVLASLIHYGDRIKVGLESVGISHFGTFLSNTQPYRQALRRAEYGDERDPAMQAFLHAISPLTRAVEIRAPLFVAQGLNDPRVPTSESAQIVAAVREHVPVWYVVYEDEGHGFRLKKNVDHYLASSVMFLEQYLLDRK